MRRGAGVVWIVGVAVASFKYGKWGPNIGTIVKILVVGIFFVLAIAFLISKGHPAGTVGAPRTAAAGTASTPATTADVAPMKNPRLLRRVSFMHFPLVCPKSPPEGSTV